MTLRSLKYMSLRALRRSGMFYLFSESSWRAHRLLILCFHGISLADEHLWNPGTYLPREVFEGRLRILRDRGYRVLPFGEAILQLRAGKLPRKSVAITFDDGFHDFYRLALPLLREYGYPATVYLTTYYSQYNVPVFGLMCSYLLWKAQDKTFGPFPGGHPNARCTDLRTPTARNEVFGAITDFAAREALTGREKHELLLQVASSLRIDLESLMTARLLHIMNRDEVAQCAASGIDIQLHTHRHYTPHQRDLFVKEIEDNRTCIRDVDRSSLVHFCYPSGFVLRDFLPWLRETGVQTATTCEYGLASAPTDPLLLPRLVDTATLDDLEFEAWLCGLRALLPLRRQRVPASGRGCVS